MATIHKKVWGEYFEKIISGKKKLELRVVLILQLIRVDYWIT